MEKLIIYKELKNRRHKKRIEVKEQILMRQLPRVMPRLTNKL
jgi:hypothetical protein